MIINTGMRTDIPAFYSEWFANRLKEGYVYTRNPYDRKSVTRYRLSPEIVDVLVFCTKNPAPMLPYRDLLKPYGQYWFVTITPYGKDIEPNVPDKENVMADFRRLSEMVGADSMGWRYDPILLNDTYTVERHLADFEKIAAKLAGYTHTSVISFIDIYKKVERNFPEARAVPKAGRIQLGKEMIRIAGKYDMQVKPCAEGTELATFGADCGGCMTTAMYEKAIGQRLLVPKRKSQRAECACTLGNDIGEYDTCGHLCRYCYANANAAAVRDNMKNHDVNSPFLLGREQEGDVFHEAKQESWIDRQISLFDGR